MECVRNLVRTYISCTLLLWILSAGTIAADWPHWRGPDYNGISSETDWDPTALKDLTIAWRKPVGTGFSSISVVNGKAYTMGNENKDTDVVYCFDAATGNELWRHEYPEDLNPKYYNGGTSSTPTVSDGRVYTLSKTARAFCLDADTGDVIWDKKLPFEEPTWGFSGSVLILGDKAIYNVGSTGLALDKTDGSVIWKSEDDKSGYATPVPYKTDEGTAVCIFGKNSVMGIDADTGKLLWSYPWKTQHDVNAADPIIHGNEVFITSGYGHGCALLRLNGTEPELVWQNKNMRSQMSGPVLIDGYLYGFDDNQLVCLDWKTGEQQWSEKAPKKGSLSAAGDKLIVIGDRGTFYIVKATPESYHEISSAQVLEHLCWSMPVLANGCIYVRDSKKAELTDLVCVDVQKKKLN